MYIGSTYVLYGLGGLNWAAMTKTGPNDASASIVWAICLTTTIGPRQQTRITPPSDAATTGGAATTTMGSRDRRRICLEHPGSVFFIFIFIFSYTVIHVLMLHNHSVLHPGGILRLPAEGNELLRSFFSRSSDLIPAESIIKNFE